MASTVNLPDAQDSLFSGTSDRGLKSPVYYT